MHTSESPEYLVQGTTPRKLLKSFDITIFSSSLPPKRRQRKLFHIFHTFSPVWGETRRVGGGVGGVVMSIYGLILAIYSWRPNCRSSASHRRKHTRTQTHVSRLFNVIAASNNQYITWAIGSLCIRAVFWSGISVGTHCFPMHTPPLGRRDRVASVLHAAAHPG